MLLGCDQEKGMPSVLITGASKGIGLSFVKYYKKLGWNVYAACRNPSALLLETSCQIVPLNLENPEFSITESIDLVINNAGVLTRSDSLNVTAQEMIESYKVNAIGPLLVVQHILPLLKNDSKIINISTRMASIDDNSSGKYIAYRASKAALNMISKTLSLDIPQIVVAIHPGVFFN